VHPVEVDTPTLQEVPFWQIIPDGGPFYRRADGLSAMRGFSRSKLFAKLEIQDNANGGDFRLWLTKKLLGRTPVRRAFDDPRKGIDLPVRIVVP